MHLRYLSLRTWHQIKPHHSFPSMAPRLSIQTALFPPPPHFSPFLVLACNGSTGLRAVDSNRFSVLLCFALGSFKWDCVVLCDSRVRINLLFFFVYCRCCRFLQSSQLTATQSIQSTSHSLIFLIQDGILSSCFFLSKGNNNEPFFFLWKEEGKGKKKCSQLAIAPNQIGSIRWLRELVWYARFPALVFLSRQVSVLFCPPK